MLRRSFDKSRKIVRSRALQGNSQLNRRAQSSKVEADVYIDGIWDPEKKMTVAGTVAECMRCGHKTESFGQKEGSERRCLVLLKSECPKGESNFYVKKEKVFDCEGCKKSFPMSQWLGTDYNICPHCNKDSLPF
jgi:DNA-directed RNA polymerase subunit RPC12/RpoP